MADHVTPLTLNDPSLFAGYDRGSVDRGIRYAAEDRVDIIEVGPDWATAQVRGTQRTPYLVDIEWHVGGRGITIADDCDCPLGGSCKHAVALIVTLARAAPVGTAPRAAPAARAIGRSSSALPSIGVGRSRAAGGDWRQALAKVAVASAAGSSPMALQFSVRAPKATYYAPDPAVQIGVRPLRMGTKGRWIKTGASWRDVESPYLHHDLHDVDPAQLIAIRTLGQSSGTNMYSAGTNPILLDRFGAALWPALRNAVDAGVALICDVDSLSVQLASEPAVLTVDLTATDADGIAVRAGFVRAGSGIDLSDGSAGTLGKPPHGLFVMQGACLELVPLDQPAHEGLAPLVLSGPVVVPAHDVDEFLDDYRPQLARTSTVTSSDGSVTDDVAELVGLVARVEHHELDAARITWAVRYRRGDRVTTYRLRDHVGPSRDRTAEAALVAVLEGAALDGAALDGAAGDGAAGLADTILGLSGHLADRSLRGAPAIVLLTEVVPWLRDGDLAIVEVTGDAPELRRAVGDPLVELDVSDPETSADGRNDWFDLSVEVSIDGEPIEFAHLFRALALDEPVLVLPSGTWMDLDRPELEQLRQLIGEARSLSEPTPTGEIRISRFQTSWWDELTGFGVVRSQSQKWADNVARLRRLSAPEPVAKPAGLSATLRPYQQHGLDWLAFLHDNELGGILADDMGLGKTVQTLALFLHVLEQRPDARFLVVAPTSVVANWHREADHFAPAVDVRTITQTASRRGESLVDAVSDARVVITSYALFRLEFDDYQELDWEMLVLDEAQFVKNHRGKTYQCVRRLDSCTKLAITGTPIENSLMDLWSLLSIVAPGLYPDPTRFSEVYRRPIESGRAPELLATLRRRVAPLMRRRTKDEVLTDLPPKTEQTVDVELSPRHMRIYQTQLQQQRKKILGLVGDVDKNRFEILKSLTVLRQLSLDPALIDDAHDAVGSAKLDRLVEDLEMVVAEGHRALVFSTFTRFLGRVKARLDDAGITYSYLDGRTRKRERAIARFTDGEADVFVISLKAGGFGLNLTQADYCFVLDPWWNPAAETQAVDRAHRIGQRNAVVVYRYVSTGTIEEKVMELKERKAALFSSVMDADDALSGALSADDIRALFESN